MTSGRAALVEVLSRYICQSEMSPGTFEVQELMYFLQVASELLRLRFESGDFGVHTDNLKSVLSMIDGYFLTGYGSESQVGEELSVLPGAEERAERVLKDKEDTRARIDRVLSLASGFESPYGMGLLAKVHWLAVSDSSLTEKELAAKMREDLPGRPQMLSDDHVKVALETLRAEEWLPAKAA